MPAETHPDIIFTKVDEAPQLASASLLPIVKSFAAVANVEVGVRDISLAGRIIAAFPENLTDKQRKNDDLAFLGEVVKTADANIIKLPNISASVPQLVSALQELHSQGYNIPKYQENPITKSEKDIRSRFDALKGSAVNPVLREGNSDRRAATAVKNYSMANPHTMGLWEAGSRTYVSTMSKDDFFTNEKSATLRANQAGMAQIELLGKDSSVRILKSDIEYHTGSVVDATFMSAKALSKFLVAQLKDTKENGVLFSIHLKATMMKVSDPIIFGHAVKAYLATVFEKYAQELTEVGANANSGMEAVISTIKTSSKSDEILAAINEATDANPPLYMVNSDKGITNLHVPSDVIIDASLPALIRAGGKAWGPDGNESDTNCVIPDSSYAPVYDETIKYFKENGALDPTKSGTVQNVGLMAQKAEEYGSHPTTFEIPADGKVRIVLENGEILHEHDVEKGDIWRSASTRQAPIKDWVQLALERQSNENCQAIFWLDETRPHDAELIKYVKPILKEANATDKFQILNPRQATRLSLETISKGEMSIAITGNVLRDYLTDLFPILELGTSAKMLSIVKLMDGGGLFETGAGGSAPKHVQQLMDENHLRWDSLGEFCALGESLKYLATVKNNKKAKVLGEAVDQATQGILDQNKSPGRKVSQPDNRTSHFYFALYWAKALAIQSDDLELAGHFEPIAKALSENKTTILKDLSSSKGKPADTGGYFHNDYQKTEKIMRPSYVFNKIIKLASELK